MSEQHSTAPTVEYRPAPGFPGYRVGDDGSVWSSYYWIKGCGRQKFIGGPWKKLKASIRKETGYVRYSLCRDGEIFIVSGHRLVLETFVGTCPEGMEARHYPDNSRTNNRLSNLSWATKSVNQRDRKFHGTADPGYAKLTKADVPVIRQRYSNGESCRRIAEDYPVDEQTIRRAARGKTWKEAV